MQPNASVESFVHTDTSNSPTENAKTTRFKAPMNTTRDMSKAKNQLLAVESWEKDTHTHFIVPHLVIGVAREWG
jgi:hypothetical protein